MQLTATIANTLWSASLLPAYWRFRQALLAPKAAQERKLHTYIRNSVHTAFGQAHHFSSIRSYEAFVRRVPLTNYSSFEPWIRRVSQGEPNVLTRDRITHLIPTSGSTGARKLIPFTAGLQIEFNAAIGPWLADLQWQFPALIGGPAYWSITPVLKSAETEKPAIPVGFDTDTAYLGGARKRLADMVMAVPSDVQRAKSFESFRYETLFYLLRCHELRLISVWHPSFLTLLLDAMPAHWESLLADIRNGRIGSQKPLPHREKELRRLDPTMPALLWPKLRVISSWGGCNAEMAIEDIKKRFPSIFIQRKGLLATECVVTIPFVGQQPLAVNSHFFEFLDAQGCVHRAHELQEGENYEVVVTTSGGLWRYRLQDSIRVIDILGRTPCLQFLGRVGNVSDRFGEKLSEPFVERIIQKLLIDSPSPRLALLAPDENPSGCRYTLYIEGKIIEADIPIRLDALLRENPHYAWCRDIGQLLAPRLFCIRARGFETFVAQECAEGKRVGDIKPCSLSKRNDWSQRFEGHYASA